MDKLKSPGKPFVISKWEVWEAYRQVKANQGAPGVDGVTLDVFEADLKNNLYRIWNVRHECERRVICRRHLIEAMLCERWRIYGPPESSYGRRFQTTTCCVG